MKSLEVSLEKTLIYMLIAIILILVLFPIGWVVSSSFKFRKEWITYPPTYFPLEPTLSNYKDVIDRYLFPQFTNSLIVATLSTLVSLILGSLAAYGLSRGSFRGKRGVGFWVLSTRMMPPIVLLIPLFAVFMKIKMIDNILSLILMHSIFNTSLVVWLMKGFYDEIPREIEEAGFTDGCSQLGVLSRILLPLSTPGLVVVGIFCFMFSWNDFLAAVVLTRSRAGTIPMALAGLTQTSRGLELGTLSSLLVIAIIPVAILGMLLSKYSVRGLTFGAVK